MACAVENYFTSVVVCGFLEDLTKIGGEVIYEAKEAAEAINNLDENIDKSNLTYSY